MRSRLFVLSFLALLLGALPTSAAMETLLGRIVSMDRQEGTMSLSLFGEDPPLTVHFSREELPEFFKEGQMVRVWGAFDAMKNGFFQATSIQTCRSGQGNDPTGVRERIGKGRSGHGGGFGGRGSGRGR